MSKNIFIPSRLARRITIEVKENGDTSLVAQSFNSLGNQVPMEAIDCASILAQLLASTVVNIKQHAEAKQNGAKI